MTKRETAEIIALLKANYPQSFRNTSDTVVKGTINLWAEMFADEPTELVRNAVFAYMASDASAFMPNVGQIKKAIQNLQAPEGGLSETEALALVAKAAKNGLYNSRAEFDELPPELQKVVGRPEQLRAWAMLDEQTFQSVIGSQVIRAYRTVKERQETFARLPSATRDFVKQLAKSLKIPEIADGKNENKQEKISNGNQSDVGPGSVLCGPGGSAERRAEDIKRTGNTGQENTGGDFGACAE